MYSCKIFYSTGGLLVVTQPSKRLKKSPAQPGEITECAKDAWIHLNLTWNELYSEDIISRVCSNCNINKLFTISM